MTYISVELRRFIVERAEGRCEYCRVPDEDGFISHEVDHIYATKHGGTTSENNLCLSCWICNRHKGSDLASLDPQTNSITPLFHPRKERWLDHFQLNKAIIVPLTPQGRVTTRLLQLNKSSRVTERELLITLQKYS
jgi:hypothetical protein